jgi:cation:H+ antiporter
VTAALALVAGIAAAAVGGELFVRGVSGIARQARIPPGIIGATVVAFATSSPEFSVAVNAAAAGRPAVAVGDALGSNVVNVGLVLAIALVIARLTPQARDLKRDLPVAMVAPVIVWLLALDGRLSRLDGTVLIAVFLVWIVVAALHARRDRSDLAEMLEEHRPRRAAVEAVVGLLLLIIAGRLVVIAAKGIGETLGWDPFLVGATLVAIATSTPELATMLVARIRHQDELTLGSILGSNVFNALWIIGVTAVIHPIPVRSDEIAIAVAAGVATLALCVPARSGLLGRVRGVALLAVYAGYLVWIIDAGS